MIKERWPTQMMKTRKTHAHELIHRAADMSDKFFESDRVTTRRLVPRLKLSLPLTVTRPLVACQDEHDLQRKNKQKDTR